MMLKYYACHQNNFLELIPGSLDPGNRVPEPSAGLPFYARWGSG